MENEINNLNEELGRMKSLFTEERLYGNLVNSEPINEEIQTKPITGGKEWWNHEPKEASFEWVDESGEKQLCKMKLEWDSKYGPNKVVYDDQATGSTGAGTICPERLTKQEKYPGASFTWDGEEIVMTSKLQGRIG